MPARPCVLGKSVLISFLVWIWSASAFVPLGDFGPNPGNLQALVSLPIERTRPFALVVLLHGCLQEPARFAVNSGWAGYAARKKISLLLPVQSRDNNSLGCFNWFHPGDNRRGLGEAASIAAMIKKILNTYLVNQVYITGLSAGASMAVVLLATYPELFDAGASVAGVSYGCAANLEEALACMEGKRTDTPELAKRAPPLMVWQGQDDSIVAPVNAHALAAQWRAAGAPVTTVLFDGGHGVPVAPARACGLPDRWTVPARLCAVSQMGAFWGLSP